jgi:hypothetical protein
VFYVSISKTDFINSTTSANLFLFEKQANVPGRTALLQEGIYYVTISF